MLICVLIWKRTCTCPYQDNLQPNLICCLVQFAFVDGSVLFRNLAENLIETLDDDAFWGHKALTTL